MKTTDAAQVSAPREPALHNPAAVPSGQLPFELVLRRHSPERQKPVAAPPAEAHPRNARHERQDRLPRPDDRQTVAPSHDEDRAADKPISSDRPANCRQNDRADEDDESPDDDSEAQPTRAVPGEIGPSVVAPIAEGLPLAPLEPIVVAGGENSAEVGAVTDVPAEHPAAEVPVVGAPAGAGPAPPSVAEEPGDVAVSAAELPSGAADAAVAKEVAAQVPALAGGAADDTSQTQEEDAVESEPLAADGATSETEAAPAASPTVAVEAVAKVELPSGGHDQPHTKGPESDLSGSGAPPPVAAADSASLLGSTAAIGGSADSSHAKGVSVHAAPAGEREAPRGASPVTVDSARLLNRVARAFHLAQQRGSELKLRLSPPELGSLRLELRVEEGVMTARLEAETQQARAALVEHLPSLRERLAEQGIRIERFDVDLMQQQGQGAGARDQGTEWERGRVGEWESGRGAKPLAENNPPLAPSPSRPIANTATGLNVVV